MAAIVASFSFGRRPRFLVSGAGVSTAVSFADARSLVSPHGAAGKR